MKKAIAAAFEEVHEAALQIRGPVPLVAKGGRVRPVIVVDKDGHPVRNATHDQIIQALLEREGVEAAVQGRRPEKVICIDCRAAGLAVLVLVPKSGPVPSRCKSCATRRKLEMQEKWLREHPRDPVKKRAIYKKWRDSHKDVANARAEAWRVENKPSSTERMRRWREKRKAAKL